jgi:outer membrane lipoprotein-sorting protein
MKPTDDIETFARNAAIDTSKTANQVVLSKMLEAFEHPAVTQSPPTRAKGSRIWRIIMKSTVTKIAAAAAIIIAIVAAVNYFGGSIDATSIAVADVVRPLLAARTGRFDMTLDLPSQGIDWVDSAQGAPQTVEVLFSGPARTRWNLPTGQVLVANFEQGKVMILAPAEKQATVMQVGPPGVVPMHNRFNQLLAIRPLIEYALRSEDQSVKSLGRRQIDGVPALGYHLAGPPHHGNITVWADPKTKLPISIERLMVNQVQPILINNIAYDVELDDSLFSVQPPRGYSLVTPGQQQPEFFVTGTVTDASTDRPIAGANVADDGYGPTPRRGAVTDAQGRYRYATWPEEHAILAEAPGYKPQRKAITGGAFHTATDKKGQVIDFALEPE